MKGRMERGMEGRKERGMEGGTSLKDSQAAETCPPAFAGPAEER